MPKSPSFVAEVAVQIDLALRQQREAGARGDTGEVEVAAGRIADLRELLEASGEDLPPCAASGNRSVA